MGIGYRDFGHTYQGGKRVGSRSTAAYCISRGRLPLSPPSLSTTTINHQHATTTASAGRKSGGGIAHRGDHDLLCAGDAGVFPDSAGNQGERVVSDFFRRGRDTTVMRYCGDGYWKARRDIVCSHMLISCCFLALSQLHPPIKHLQQFPLFLLLKPHQLLPTHLPHTIIRPGDISRIESRRQECLG